MRIAAIIPLYNKAPYVAAALDSVLTQTKGPDEIVVVDDASTDDGPAIVSSCPDPRVRLIRRAAAGPGGYAARNVGIATTNAEWLAFLDADDVWTPDHLATFVALAAAHPQAGCLATRYDHVFSDRRESDRIAGPVAVAACEDGCVSFADFLESWLAAGDCPLWTGALAIHRDVLAISGTFPEGRAERGGDKDLWLRVVRATPLAFSGRSTAYFRREAADKLTDRTSTCRLPCLVATAQAMAKDVALPEQRLLRRLINQEIGLYARWSARVGGRPKIAFGDLSWPATATEIATLAGSKWLPSRLLRLAYRYEHYRRAQARSR